MISMESSGEPKKRRVAEFRTQQTVKLTKLSYKQTLDLIPLFSKITIRDPEAEFSLPADLNPSDPDAEFDFESSLQILSETKKLELENRFKKDADAYYVEAKRSVVSTMSQIPSWVYGLLVVLGRNDLKGILFNPLQIVVVAILGAGV